MWKQIQKQWFLLGLLAAMIVGYSFQDAIAPAAASPLIRQSIVASVLFLMGLGFSVRALVGNVRSPKATLLATAINVLAVPGLAAFAALLLSPELGSGLIVAASVPSTLASASLWTRRAGGDDSVSMLVTIATNLSCFLVTPAILIVLLRQMTEIDFIDQAMKLACTVVAPLLLAQLLLRVSGVGRFVRTRQTSLSFLSQTGILLMVAIGAAATSSKMEWGATDNASNMIMMIALVVVVHLTALFGGWWAAGTIGIERPQRIAVAISGSQKTLMVGLQVTLDCGVSLLPMVVYHIIQLVLDTITADRWARTRDIENR